ncbi:MAG: formate/nitrite transporter family protein [Armatimonadota bacterium]
MYTEALTGVCETAEKKVRHLSENPLGYLTAAMLAGVYVGVGVCLAFIVGGPLSAAHSPFLKVLMGGSFAVALSLVVFAGAELFTGNNMVLAVGWWTRKNSILDMHRLWLLSWGGNLLGAALLAVLLYYSAVLNGAEELALVQKIAAKKMTLAPMVLLTRGILCNWLVCLAVWCVYRMKSETGKLIMIFWCLYAFVAAGFEHSVANMTLLTLSLLQPHSAAVSVIGMGYNLLWVTVGNILGGAIFVGGAYWIANHGIQSAQALETEIEPTPEKRYGAQPAYQKTPTLSVHGSSQVSAN